MERTGTEPKVSIRLELPASHRDRIAAIAAEQDRSAAYVYRGIVADFIAYHDETGAPK